MVLENLSYLSWEIMQTCNRRSSMNNNLGNELMSDPLRDELRAFMENSDKKTQALMEQNEKNFQALLQALQNLSSNNTREENSNHSENNNTTPSQATSSRPTQPSFLPNEEPMGESNINIPPVEDVDEIAVAYYRLDLEIRELTRVR